MDYDFEKFKENTCAIDEGSARHLLQFKSKEELTDFATFILDHSIPRSGYGLEAHQFDEVGLFWNCDVREVWGAKLYQAEKIYFLEDFKILPFVSTEEDLFNFLNW